jgi:hypothetical protein
VDRRGGQTGREEEEGAGTGVGAAFAKSLKGANLNNPGPKWLCHFPPGVEIKIRQGP